MEVRMADRKSAVLTPSELPCLSRQPTVNFTRGCALGCAYCYAQGYSGYPGDGVVVVYANTAEKVRAELPRKRKRPGRVFFSPSTDAFQPIPALHDTAYTVFEFLLGNGINISFSTKGRIPQRFIELFARHADRVQAQVGVISMNEAVTAQFEPCAPPPRERLAQIRRLADAGVGTEARIDPILPGATDDEASLDVLCAALADAGVGHAALNILYLRPSIRRALKRKVSDTPLLQRVLKQYEFPVSVPTSWGKWTQDALPAPARAAILSRATRIATAHGIRTRVCGCMNHDVQPGNCNLGGRWPKPTHFLSERQSELDLEGLE